MKTYSTTDFRKNIATAFNDVQANGFINVAGQSRPKMVLMLESEHQAMQEKINQLTALIKAQ